MQRERTDERGKSDQEQRDAGVERLVAPVQDERVANRKGQECEGRVPSQSCELDGRD